MKLKKRRKSGRFRGSRMHGNAAKKSKGKGNRGGKGMSGTGKKAGQKKNYVEKYFHPYFGKQGFTSRSTEKRKNLVINVGDINRNYESGEINLEGYKILGEGEVSKKFVIKASLCSPPAKEKIEKAGGKITLEKEKEVKEKKEVK